MNFDDDHDLSSFYWSTPATITAASEEGYKHKNHRPPQQATRPIDNHDYIMLTTRRIWKVTALFGYHGFTKRYVNYKILE